MFIILAIELNKIMVLVPGKCEDICSGEKRKPEIHHPFATTWNEIQKANRKQQKRSLPTKAELIPSDAHSQRKTIGSQNKFKSKVKELLSRFLYGFGCI